jgi:hypothetical protein
LYIYGRPQDASAQKARSTIHERNHARFWLSPIRFQGKEVWVGQVSRDIGIKFSLESPTIVTHVIDPDVDATRRYFVEDLAYSSSIPTSMQPDATSLKILLTRKHSNGLAPSRASVKPVATHHVRT